MKLMQGPVAGYRESAVAAGTAPCRPLVICVCLILSALVLPAISPPSDTIYEVRLVDGSALVARVAEIDGDKIVFMTVGGVRVEVERSQIQSVTPATSIPETRS